MTKVKLYTRDRLILHGVASDYARDNPDVTASQLSQLFAIDQCEAIGIINSVKAGTSIGPEQTQEILDWAIQNDAGMVRIMQQFGVTERTARKIAKSVRANDPQKPKHVFATGEALAFAKQYCADNPEVPCETIARQFGVSGTILRRFRRIHNVKIQVGGSLPSVPVVRSKPRRTLYAVLSDGEQIDPRRVRDVSKIQRFVEVMV